VPNVVIVVKQADAEGGLTSVLSPFELTELVVAAINDLLGPRALDLRAVGAGPASVVSARPLAFECPVDCDPATVDLLHLSASTDQPFAAAVTDRLSEALSSEDVVFDVAEIRASAED
jgi:hypothetical protein